MDWQLDYSITRLLDWSQNPLVAAYFATESEYKKDGAIYIYEAPEQFAKNDIAFEQINGLQGVIGYIPRSLSPRVINQKGLFTIHCPADMPIAITDSKIMKGEVNICKIIIKSVIKKDINEMLNDYGINASTLFPDLDGLSKFMNIQTEIIAR